MKFDMVRKSLDRAREQVSDKKNDQHIKHFKHVDYVYLTNIPSSVDFDEIDEAFDSFALKIGKRIEHFTQISSYFADVHLTLDDATDFWTFRFRFDKFRLEKDYTIDTDAVEEDAFDNTANTTPPNNGNAVYSALVAGSNNDFI